MNSHWSEYWKQGHTTSFGDSFKQNYEGELKEQWNSLFDNLPNDFAALDIGTGNGALPLLLRERCEGHNGKVVGIDYAQVDMESRSTQSTVAIELESNVNCEDLSYENGSFDAVISQFGIEYSNLDLSLAEASRVLKVNGILALVMHHADSLIIRRNKRILNIVKSDEARLLLDIMSNLVTSMGAVQSAEDIVRIKSDPACEQLREQLNSTITELVSKDENALKDSELMTYVAKLFKEGMYWSMAEKQRYLSFAQHQIATLELRLEELIQASVCESRLGELIAKLNKIDLTLVAVKVLKSAEKDIVSWAFMAKKI